MTKPCFITAALWALVCLACSDDSREPRDFIGPGTTVGSSAGGQGGDACDPLPDACEPFDSCPCVIDEPGVPARLGTVECDSAGQWTACGIW